MNHYEAVVVGAGPGGYEAAIELAGSGVKTLLIERDRERIGGICLNEGCIPAKNYLESAAYAQSAPYFSGCGLLVETRGLDLKRLAERTAALKNELRSGIIWLLDRSGAEVRYGMASFVDPHTLDVGGERVSFERCLIATGSKVRELPQLPLDGKRILSSTDVFALEELPRSVAIVGGGAIGCEFATFFNAFGVEVTLIVRGERLLAGEDEEISKALLRAFKKRGIAVLTSTTVERAEIEEEGVRLLVSGEGEHQIVVEKVLCAAGRLPSTDLLCPEKGGVELDTRGFVVVDGAFRTSQPHIYAVGDCIDTPAYAHTAYAEARVAARNMIGGGDARNEHFTPSAVFSAPPVASCGLRESEAAQQGIAVEVKRAFFKASPKAKIKGDDEGFVKIVVSPTTGTILGASIVGVEATEIIHELSLAIEKQVTLEELSSLIHIHPSVSEIFRSL